MRLLQQFGLILSLQLLSFSSIQAQLNPPPFLESEGFNWSAEMQVNFQIDSDGSLIGRLNACIGASYQEDWWQAACNFNINFYDKGLGTPYKASKKRMFQADWVLSPMITVGFGEDDLLPTFTFNEMSPSQVYNPYRFAFTFGQNLILNNHGRHQRIGSYGIRADLVSLHFYNDVLGFFGDGRDRWWSGGGQINLQLNEFQYVSLGTEVFTGLVARTHFGRPILDNRNPTNCNYGTYVMATTLDKQLNNGHTYIKFNELNWTASAALIGSFRGMSAGYFQNFIHRYLYPTPFFNYKNIKGGLRIGASVDDQFPTIFMD